MDPTSTKHHFVVTLSLMAATMMTTTPCSGDNAMPLSNDAILPCDNLTPLGARSVLLTLHSGNNTNLGDVATPLGACLVTTTPRLGNNAPPLGDDAMPLGNDPTLLGARSATTATTMLRSGNDAILGEVATPFGARLVTLTPSLATKPHQVATMPCRLAMTPRSLTTMPG
jgi:hypothetical protein